MDLVFYATPMSSSTPVATVLAELEVPHETVTIDLSKGEEGKGELRKHNPHGKVPTLGPVPIFGCRKLDLFGSP